jgi:hypothetical protein
MDMTTLARDVMTILHRQYGDEAPRIWVGLMTTPAGWWQVEGARGYACALPAGTTPLPYDTARYRDVYDAFDAAWRVARDQLENQRQAELDQRQLDDDEEEEA